MAKKMKILKIVKYGKKSFDVTCNKTQWTNIDNFQVIGCLANIIESELKKNKTETGEYDIIIITK